MSPHTVPLVWKFAFTSFYLMVPPAFYSALMVPPVDFCLPPKPDLFRLRTLRPSTSYPCSYHSFRLQIQPLHRKALISNQHDHLSSPALSGGFHSHICHHIKLMKCAHWSKKEANSTKEQRPSYCLTMGKNRFHPNPEYPECLRELFSSLDQSFQWTSIISTLGKWESIIKNNLKS